MPELTLAAIEQMFDAKLDQKLKGLATKTDLASLEAKINEQHEHLARMVAEGFDDIRDRLDVRERLALVEQKLLRVQEVLHLSR